MSRDSLIVSTGSISLVVCVERIIWQGLMKGARPLFYEWFSEAEVAKLEEDATRELESAANSIYGRSQVSWGYRRGASA